MTNYTINVSLKTLKMNGLPRFERHQFSFCAASRDEARALASANVKSQGFPHDVKLIEIVDAIPISTSTALVPFDPRFHKFDWTTVADAGHQALMNELRALGRSQLECLASVREATQVVHELTEVLAA